MNKKTRKRKKKKKKKRKGIKKVVFCFSHPTHNIPSMSA